MTIVPQPEPAVPIEVWGVINVTPDSFSDAGLYNDPAAALDKARRLIADGTISGGMIPKVETCIYALDAGVEGVVIMDGKVPHAVLLELMTDHGVGTLIHR